MSQFQKVATTPEIPLGTAKRVEVDGNPIAIVHHEDGNFYAISDVCTHDEASLSDGRIAGNEIECPWHGACFRIDNGEVLTPPAVENLDTYRIRVTGEDIEVDVAG